MLDVNQIKEILPHRYPFLLVDRVIELTKESAIGIKNVTINEPFFQGHYPGHPVMPGVLILESIAQVGVIMMMYPGKENGLVPYLASIDKIKFRKPVYPGDQLKIIVQLLRMKANMGKVKAEAFVEDQLVAEGEMMYALVKGKEK